MSFLLAPALLTRLRASTRLIALVLVMFLLKVGVVAACATHDFGDAGMASAEQASGIVKVTVDSGDDGQPAEPTAGGGCVDCHCHHAATLVPEVMPQVPVVRAVEPPITAVSARTVRPGQELRPPIV